MKSFRKHSSNSRCSKKTKKNKKGGMFRGYNLLHRLRNRLYPQSPIHNRYDSSNRSSDYNSEDSDVGLFLSNLGAVRPPLRDPLPELHSFNEKRFNKATRRCRPYSPYRGYYSPHRRHRSPHGRHRSPHRRPHAHTVGGKKKNKKN